MVVCDRFLQTDREGPTLISHAALLRHTDFVLPFEMVHLATAARTHLVGLIEVMNYLLDRQFGLRSRPGTVAFLSFFVAFAVVVVPIARSAFTASARRGLGQGFVEFFFQQLEGGLDLFGATAFELSDALFGVAEFAGQSENLVLKYMRRLAKNFGVLDMVQPGDR